MNEMVCPDCKLAPIRKGDRCDHCGLSWEDVETAAAFYDHLVKEKQR